jgi:hypothetical protein
MQYRKKFSVFGIALLILLALSALAGGNDE